VNRLRNDSYRTPSRLTAFSDLAGRRWSHVQAIEGGESEMNVGKRWILALVLAGSTAGGVLGGTLLSAGAGNAASGTTTQSAPSGAPSGKFVPNENAAHEANESAAREAQEDAGQFPTVP
jgi:hypothetical protein